MTNRAPDPLKGCGLMLVIAFFILALAVVIVAGAMLGLWNGFLSAAGLAR